MVVGISSQHSSEKQSPSYNLSSCLGCSWIMRSHTNILRICRRSLLWMKEIESICPSPPAAFPIPRTWVVCWIDYYSKVKLFGGKGNCCPLKICSQRMTQTTRRHVLGTLGQPFHQTGTQREKGSKATPLVQLPLAPSHSSPGGSHCIRRSELLPSQLVVLRTVTLRTTAWIWLPLLITFSFYVMSFRWLEPDDKNNLAFSFSFWICKLLLFSWSVGFKMS